MVIRTLFDDCSDWQCGDISCDAPKKSFIKDEDGTFLGGQSGAVVPDSAYGYGETAYGNSDQRIPKTMLVTKNGDQIPISEVRTHIGKVDLQYVSNCANKIFLSVSW